MAEGKLSSSSAIFPGPRAALIGYTGYVGSNLLAQFSPCRLKDHQTEGLGYKALFNRENIASIQEEVHARDIDTIVCAGAPGFKLGANLLDMDLQGNQYDDTKAVDDLISDLDRIRVDCCRTVTKEAFAYNENEISNSTGVSGPNQTPKQKKLFILISTISVYSVCSDSESEALEDSNLKEHGSDFYAKHVISSNDVHTLDETRDVWTRPGPLSDGGLSDTTYGRNRARLEYFVKGKFGAAESEWDYLLIRLPGIFGINMRKNYIFDLLTKSPWRNKINLNTYHQWYPLRRLTEDIKKVVLHNRTAKRCDRIRTVNFFPEPLKTERIIDVLFPEQRAEVAMKNSETPFVDDVRTKEGWLWDSNVESCEKDESVNCSKTTYCMSAEESLRELADFKMWYGTRDTSAEYLAMTTKS